MRRWLKRIVIVLAVFVLPSVAFYFYVTWQGVRELRGVLDELDANESPWRWSDLQNSRPPLAEENDLRPLVVEITSFMPRNFGARTRGYGASKPNQLLWPEHLEIYSEDVKAAEEGLILARKLAGLPHGRLQIRWSGNLVAIPVDDLQKSRAVAHLLNVSAMCHAHHGDLDTAMQECLALQRLFGALEEYGLICYLVRVAVQGVALGALERVLGQGQPTPAQLQQLQQAWEQVDSHHALMAAFRGERAYTHWLFEAAAEGKITMHDLRGAPAGTVSWEDWCKDLYLHYNWKQSHAWTLRHWTSILKALELPEFERAARLRELDEGISQAPRAARQFSPAFISVLKAHERCEIRRRCALVGLACERFRRSHGRWPQTIDELSPKFIAHVPEDPCSGGLLQLRPTADGLVVFSVGPDGKLRGSYHDEESPNGLHANYEFRLWNVNQRRRVDPRQ